MLDLFIDNCLLQVSPEKLLTSRWTETTETQYEILRNPKLRVTRAITKTERKYRRRVTPRERYYLRGFTACESCTERARRQTLKSLVDFVALL